MGYKELLSSIDCKFVVIIEDDFEQIEYKKERALYDITRMAIDDRCQYLSEIETVSPTLHEILSKFLFASLNFCLMLPIKRYPQPQIGKKLTHLIKNAEVYTGSVIFVKTLLNNRPVYGILVKDSLPLDRSKALNAKERFS